MGNLPESPRTCAGQSHALDGAELAVKPVLWESAMPVRRKSMDSGFESRLCRLFAVRN